jgi:hypothetical protein
MQVKYLQIGKKSGTHEPYRWVRYVTQANSYVARIWCNSLPLPPLPLFFVVPVFILLTLFFNYKFINYIQFKHRRHSLLCHSLCIHELVLQLGNTYVSILFPISHKRITYSRYQACTLWEHLLMSMKILWQLFVW